MIARRHERPEKAEQRECECPIQVAGLTLGDASMSRHRPAGALTRRRGAPSVAAAARTPTIAPWTSDQSPVLQAMTV